LEEAVEKYNEATGEKDKKPVEDAISIYNDALDSAQGFCETIVGDIEEFMEEKSEKWQESDKGEAHANWKDSWDITLDPITWDMLITQDGDPLDLSSIEPANETLDALATEPE